MIDLIKRSDAIKAIDELREEPYWLHDGDDYRVCGLSEAKDAIERLPSADRPQVNPDLVKDFLKRQYEATLEDNKKLAVKKWQAEQVLQTIIQQLEYVLEHGAVDEDGTHPITVENVLACIRAWTKGADNETANNKSE